MAATTGPAVAEELVAAGASPATPVAVVVRAGGAGQAVGRCDLDALAARAEPLPGPCVIVIGDVAAAADAAVLSTMVACGRGAGRRQEVEIGPC